MCSQARSVQWLVLGLLLVVGSSARAAGLEDLELEVHDAINAVRVDHGLSRLRLDPALAAVARGHSRHMASAGFFAHAAPDGRTHVDRIRAAGIPYQVAAENLAMFGGYGLDLRDRAVSGWMNSPGHRANILLGDVAHGGVGVAQAGARVYLTQLFLLGPSRVAGAGGRARPAGSVPATGLGAASAARRRAGR